MDYLLFTRYVLSINMVPIVSDRALWFDAAVRMTCHHRCVNYGQDRIGGN